MLRSVQGPERPGEERLALTEELESTFVGGLP